MEIGWEKKEEKRETVVGNGSGGQKEISVTNRIGGVWYGSVAWHR